MSRVLPVLFNTIAANDWTISNRTQLHIQQMIRNLKYSRWTSTSMPVLHSKLKFRFHSNFKCRIGDYPGEDVLCFHFPCKPFLWPYNVPQTRSLYFTVERVSRLPLKFKNLYAGIFLKEKDSRFSSSSWKPMKPRKILLHHDQIIQRRLFHGTEIWAKSSLHFHINKPWNYPLQPRAPNLSLQSWQQETILLKTNPTILKLLNNNILLQM